MQSPAQITFRGLERSPALEARILEHLTHLERLTDRITHCHVTIERVGGRHRHGELFDARVQLHVGGARVEVTRHPRQALVHDPYVALRVAFDTAARQLEELVRVRRAEVKRHETAAHGRVIRIFPGQDSGFLVSSDGLEVYFHRHAVAGAGYERLGIGDEVRFVLAPDAGAHGPQASTVTSIGKHHLDEREGRGQALRE